MHEVSHFESHFQLEKLECHPMTPFCQIALQRKMDDFSDGF